MTPTRSYQGPGGNASGCQPLVSVVIPVYNASAYIAATLDSVFQQTFSNYEVILINDGSADTIQLEAVLEPYISRLRYLAQENRGPSAARNRGIREAHGRYVALLDSDDLWLPDHLGRQLEQLEKMGSSGLVYSNNLQLREGRFLRNAFDEVPQADSVTLDSLLSEACTVNTSSVVVSRDFLLQAGLFNESLNRCEDFDLWLRVAALGSRMGYDREIHVIHRLGHGLASDSLLMKRARADVYRNAVATLQLSAAQKGIVAAKLKQLEREIEIEAARASLEAGRFQEACVALNRANAISPTLKLRSAELGLRWFPSLTRWSYKNYVGFLRWRKRRRPSSISQTVPNLDTLMGKRSVL